MDVLTLDRARSKSTPAEPREPAMPASRRWLLELPPLRILRSASGGTGGDAITRQRNLLLAYTGATIALGLGLLAITTLVAAPWSTIDPGVGATTVLAGPTGGMLLWLLYGLIGSLRVLRVPGGASLTFHLPFIGAAMVLGGPTAGAWVAFLSTLERRELETQPWYGILANHSIMVVAAVAGGLTVRVIDAVLPADAGGSGLLAAAAAGAVVLAAVNTAMGALTVLLREHLSVRALADILLGQVGRITAIECALVVVLAFAYVQIAWWAPLVVAGFVLLVWDNDPMPARDRRSGLDVAEGFERRLDVGIGRLRRGMAPGAAVLFVDLDRFKQVNETHGHPVGHEVIAEVGRRLRAQARRPDDVAGRLGGDEFGLYLPGLCEVDTAMRRAEEVVASLRQPIATSAGTVWIGASVGVVVVHAWGGVPSGNTLLDHADDAMYHAKHAGGGVHLYDPTEPSSVRGERSEPEP